jgi:putative spermidine/putrescine transport system permease protein
VPYIVITVSASLQSLDRSLEEAALNLGASEWRAFLHVILPALIPGLVAGAVFAFIESFDEFIMTFFITTFRLTLPIQIFNSLAYQLDPSVAAVSSAALAMTMLLTVCLLLRGQLVAGGRIVR